MSEHAIDHTHIDDLAAFVTASPTSYHAAAEVASRLDAAGFTGLQETDDWSSVTTAGTSNIGAYVVRDGAVIAWQLPADAAPTTPFRIVGTHTDSPAFQLKPNPDLGAHGYRQAALEVYGGPLLNSWLDRELELAGRLVTRDGTEHLVRTGPFLRIPQLAIHLDRDVNDSLTLDRARHLSPVFGVGRISPGDLVAHLAGLAGLDAGDVVGHDVLTADTAAPARFGLDGTLFASARLDNLISVHAGLVALLDSSDSAAGNDAGHVNVLAAFDHEELGSASRSGASGTFLLDVLARIGAGLGATPDEQARAYAGSWCVSSDSGHAVHPNYPERHDLTNRPVLGGGPLRKVNANQRYATDAHGSALWSRCCAAAGVPMQEFVSVNTIPCGSTIGPLTATRLGIRVVDVGVAQLSMHSARELCHVADPPALTAALQSFYAGS